MFEEGSLQIKSIDVFSKKTDVIKPQLGRVSGLFERTGCYRKYWQENQ